jgi:DNA-binding NarL/FixJ family response regulator
MVKSSAALDLVRAIRSIRSGATFFCPHVSTVLAEELRRRGSDGPNESHLSERETEILRRIADGQSTKEIAFALGLSGRTVEAHRAHLMSKLGIFSAAGLTKFALREGLTKL